MEPFIPNTPLAPTAIAVSVRKGLPLVLATLSAVVAIVSCLVILQSLPLRSIPSGSPGLSFIHADEDLCGRSGCGFADPRPVPPADNDHPGSAPSFLLTPIVIPINPDAGEDRLFPPLHWGEGRFEIGGFY